MTSTLLIAWLLSAQLCGAASPSVIKSSALIEMAEDAQRNRSACGPLAVWYVLGKCGHRASADELIASAGLSKSGTTIRRLLELLSEHDCPAQAITTDKNRLELLPVPSILIVDKGSHCVVFDGLDDKRQSAKIFETTSKEIRFVDLKELRRTWTGEAIICDSPRPSRATFFALCFFAASIIVAPAGCLLLRRRDSPRHQRAGFTAIELLLAIAIVGSLMAIVLPSIQQARESSRATQCRANLHQLGIALHNYELSYRVFPPAVVWKPAGEPLGQSIAPPGSFDRISYGVASSAGPDRVYANWVVSTLPFLEEEDLYNSFDLRVPLGSAVNAAARATELPFMKCPTDPANSVDNHFQRSGLAATDVGYARGNYAINGGTSRRCLTRLSTRKVNCTDGVNVNGTDLRVDTSQVWGNGVTGVNRSMRAAEFICGASKLVLVEEIRAGVHPLDRRGVWSLGFAGSSVTACHGLYGNNGPNRGKDVIQGCSQVSAQVADLEFQGMPCVRSQTDPWEEISDRATARSTHAGGVNLVMADGSTHFVSDSIDRRVWHNIHKRDNQQPIDF